MQELIREVQVALAAGTLVEGKAKLRHPLLAHRSMTRAGFPTCDEPSNAFKVQTVQRSQKRLA
jgi:hypothetical protein